MEVLGWWHDRIGRPEAKSLGVGEQSSEAVACSRVLGHFGSERRRPAEVVSP